MAIGLGVLRLDPANFWRMTPREFAAAARPLVGRSAERPSRSRLAEMMAQFPDERDVFKLKGFGHG